jgi:transcriptional regulator with XRE-family HTH domain
VARAANFEDLYRDAEEHDDYWVAGLIHDFTEELVKRMEKARITRAELARRLGSSPAYVTKILRGNGNFTLTTMVRLARAVGMEVRLDLVAPGQSRSREERYPQEPLAEWAVAQDPAQPE